MDAIVLAGGYATRLWPITRHRPKMFLPVGEQTVVDRVFEELEDDERIERVYVSTNQRFAEDFQTYLASASYDKPELSVEETTAEEEKLGVVGALAQLTERENIDDDTIVVAGDNLISFDLSDFIDFFEKQETPCLAAYDVESREKAKSYGLVELAGDRVVDFQEKPSDPNSTLVSIACYAFTAETVGLLSTYLDEGNNPDEPGWFVQWVQESTTVRAFTFDGAWFDIGTPESYLDAVAWTLNGNTIIADDAIIENVTVGDNVHVMAGAEIVDASIDRSVVFPGATLRDCDVRDSIVDTETSVENVDLSGALVGAHTRINGE